MISNDLGDRLITCFILIGEISVVNTSLLLVINWETTFLPGSSITLSSLCYALVLLRFSSFSRLGRTGLYFMVINAGFEKERYML